jgi:hypothetical protein
MKVNGTASVVPFLFVVNMHDPCYKCCLAHELAGIAQIIQIIKILLDEN